MFDGCDFKRSDKEAVKKHEDGCENRYVPCAKCDLQIGQKGLAEHVSNKHGKVALKTTSEQSFWTGLNGLDKTQFVFEVSSGVDCQKFLLNWYKFDEVSKLFWMAYIGPKDLASSYKYTVQVQKSKAEEKKYAFEGTRYCVPCDLSHEDVKRKRCALMLEKELVDSAAKDDNKLHYSVTIFKE